MSFWNVKSLMEVYAGESAPSSLTASYAAIGDICKNDEVDLENTVADNFIPIFERAIASMQNDDIVTSNDEVNFENAILNCWPWQKKLELTIRNSINMLKIYNSEENDNLIEQLNDFFSAILRQKQVLMSHDFIKRKLIQQRWWLKPANPP